MPILEDTFTASLDAVTSSTAALPHDSATIRPLGDDELVAMQRTLADARRAIDTCASLVAGEVAHRSRHELGYDGLAQRTGFRTPEALVQHMTGSTARDASTLVQVGTMMIDADHTMPSDPSAEVHEPWLIAIGAAVRAGQLTIDVARAIRSGLGTPTSVVTIEHLAHAAGTLLSERHDLHADAFFRRARELRQDLDASEVAGNEAAIHAARAFRRYSRPGGLRRFVIDADLESGAYLDDVFDKLTAPRRGGVRFTSEDDKRWAALIATDERTVEQYAHDAFTELLRIGVEADLRAAEPGTRRTIGSHQPAVRVLVSADQLAARAGRGHIEGVDTPVSIATVERIACADGIAPIVFRGGVPLDLGRTQRLFTANQRIALSARDGGCRFGECDRPPEWCEAHHILYWERDRGRSDIDNGILLCRHHHMLIHNNGWEIERRDAEYLLVPPASVDPQRMPRPMPSKSRALRDLCTRDLRTSDLRASDNARQRAIPASPR